MIYTYDEFIKIMNSIIVQGDELYLDLLEKVIDYPNRYCGLFRLSNAKTKLIQNVTQSQEIKFGDFMETIVTDYLEQIGYDNLDKNIGDNDDGDNLNVDQLFTDSDNCLYLVEQKIRDDHDSSKKRGQLNNFQEKIELLRKQHKKQHLKAYMWFIDDSLQKNKNFYSKEIKQLKYENTELYLCYGKEFVNQLGKFEAKEMWKELNEYLIKFRSENNEDVIQIPDFGSSDEIYNSLLKLNQKRWQKLLSDDDKYVQIRKELFSNGDNIEKAIRKRGKN